MDKLLRADVASITLDLDEDTVTLVAEPQRAHASVSVTVSLDLTKPNMSVLAAVARQLVMEAVNHANVQEEDAASSSETPCSTCTSACCKEFDEIRVTQMDAWALPPDSVKLFSHEALDGSVGIMRKSPTGYCVHRKPDGCGVYEIRPQSCRDFPAHGCSLYEPDRDKVAGKVRLRVMP